MGATKARTARARTGSSPSQGKGGRTTASPTAASAGSSAALATGPVGVLDLQRQVGNAAMASLLGGGAPGAPLAFQQLQRESLQREKTKKPLEAIQDLLSYSMFDWMITDSDAVTALYLISLQPSRSKIVQQLGEKFRYRLVDNLPDKEQKGTSFRYLLLALTPENQDRWVAGLKKGAGLARGQKSALKKLFASTPDGSVDRLKKMFETRWNVKTGADTTEANGVEWDAPGLRRSFAVLDKLPASHVEGNKDFKKYLRYDDGKGMGGGYFQGSTGVVSMDYTSGQATMDQKNVSEAGDPLNGVNRFDKVVRHEVGHAVDKRMGWSDGSEPATDGRGGWKTYGSSFGTVASEMIAASAGGIAGLTADQKTDVVADMTWCVANKAGSSLLGRLKARGWWAGLEAGVKTDVENDQVLRALKYALVGKSPWYKAPNGGIALGGRVYQESYGNDWSSYKASTRSRKVSQYQFRAPGEWFAEAYGAYYEPGASRGGTLKASDPSTKKYFDDVVHKLKW